MSKKFDVILKTVTDVKDFVQAAMKLPFEIMVGSGRYIVDGKSLMGIFSLDLSKPLAVSYNEDDADCYSDISDNFLKLCKKWK